MATAIDPRPNADLVTKEKLERLHSLAYEACSNREEDKASFEEFMATWYGRCTVALAIQELLTTREQLEIIAAALHRLP